MAGSLRPGRAAGRSGHPLEQAALRCPHLQPPSGPPRPRGPGAAHLRLWFVCRSSRSCAPPSVSVSAGRSRRGGLGCRPGCRLPVTQSRVVSLRERISGAQWKSVMSLAKRPLPLTPSSRALARRVTSKIRPDSRHCSPLYIPRPVRLLQCWPGWGCGPRADARAGTGPAAGGWEENL